MDDIARPSRKGLSFWGIFLSLLLGFGAWWGVGQLTEPRPAWTRQFSANQQVLLPLSEAADANRMVAFEMKLDSDNPSECKMTGIVILDTRTGATQYHLPLPNDPWRPEQYIMQTYHQALPRIIGEVVWRINIVETEKDHRCELRAWDFSQSQQEKIVQSWDYAPGARFDVAFASSNSPYMITQTKYRCEPMLAGLGLEGWSRLTAQIAYGQAVGMKASGDRGPVFGGSPQHPGLFFFSVQTWQLPAQPGEALTPMASWMLPSQRTVWPPACGKDLAWVAFGDLHSRLQMYEIKHSLGLLLYDGHTGKPRSHNLASSLPVFVSVAGDYLMITSPLKPQENAKENKGYQHRIVDPETGKEVALPAELATTVLPVVLFPDQAQPGQYLVTMGIADQPFNMGIPTEKNTLFVGRLQRTAAGLLVAKPMISLKDELPEKSSTTTHFRSNEIGVLGSIDNAPPLLRTLAEKWEWLKTWTEKYWPRDNMTLMLFDINTGKPLRRIRDAMVTQLTNASNKNMLYTVTYRRGPPPHREAIEALCGWQLPIETLGTSPWWCRMTGLLVFVLAILSLRRRQTRTA